jgi:hypothetical protein
MDDETGELLEFIDTLSGQESLNAESVAGLRKLVTGEAPADLPAELVEEKSQQEEERQWKMKVMSEDEHVDLRAKLVNMPIPEKIKLALFGNSLCRMLLILDNSRVVQLCVLRSPRLRVAELEVFVKNPNISELVLREISKSRKWMKSYSLKLHIVTNPKTPGDVALKWLHFLVKADLRKIAMSRNLPQLVVVNARKLVADAEKKRS